MDRDRSRVSFSSSTTESDSIAAPLIPNRNGSSSSGSGSEGGSQRGSRSRVQGAARFLRRAGSRRLMREPSMLVRESAAEQLEVRQSDWAYSKPVVVLDLIWNLAFVLLSLAVLVLSRKEKNCTELRIWIVGYALQCVVHMLCVCCEYLRRQQQQQQANANSSLRSTPNTSASINNGETDVNSGFDDDGIYNDASWAKRLESANTMFSFVWWIVGFYWITAGGQSLAVDAPHVYWLCVVFLAFDVFFVVFCVALACVIGIAVCCCLPCIIAILYAVADQEGASEEDINNLPSAKFRKIYSDGKGKGDTERPLAGVMTFVGASANLTERSLFEDDAECCICLSSYEDGVELRHLPCSHHFHSTCISKWLRINATCPLCKYNIVHGNRNRTESV
ncbi:E3 ubiquitin-protein ligase At1g12760-like [Physcomitrium patens]|uniref:RING-type E3 ubiquitin transferase n=1 Tax=Physcomitrium patens TaxID=3218 RepID=A0A7I4ERM5_PHYPA|nr:E3 ubiquitin-protein ligase At1g12760-like [Physcomitrium patens]|eukprot:XP_024366323.1 E3 ubiquitin-protein ligase At1g12760-like [Physcomitrella patens]